MVSIGKVLVFIVSLFFCIQIASASSSNQKNKDENLESLMDYIKLNIENENKPESVLSLESNNEDDVESYIDNLVLVLHRFERTLSFMEHNSNSLNLDGLYGVRIAQGVINNINSELDSQYKSLENTFYKASKSLINKLSKRLYLLAETAMKATFADNQNYFINFYPLVADEFKISYKPGLKLEYNLIQEETFIDTSLSEEVSDGCYELLLGTATKDGNKVDKCSTSDDCLAYYTANNTGDYYLTHQLLFFMMAKNGNCSDKVLADLKQFIVRNNSVNANIINLLNKEKSVEDGIESLNNYYCSKIYKNAEINVRSGRKLLEFPKDLFIEQLLLCSMLGYNEFHNLKWFKLVLKFQQLNGCFGGNPAGKTTRLDDDSTELYDSIKNIYGSYYLRNPMNEPNYYFYKRGKLRSKRYDKTMGSYCSSHETGIALAYYSLSIKYNLKAILDN